jgi:hypothetical protein
MNQELNKILKKKQWYSIAVPKKKRNWARSKGN